MYYGGTKQGGTAKQGGTSIRKRMRMRWRMIEDVSLRNSSDARDLSSPRDRSRSACFFSWGDSSFPMLMNSTAFPGDCGIIVLIL